MIRYAVFAVLAWLVAVPSAYADGFFVSPTKFRFHPREYNFNGFDAVRWSPKPAYNFPQISAHFFGQPNPQVQCRVKDICERDADGNIIPGCTEGCDWNDDHACFVLNPVGWNGTDQTGLEQPTVWTPQCPDTSYTGSLPIRGSSLAATSTAPSGAGIGLYNLTGNKAIQNELAFYQPKERQILDNIEALYVRFPVKLVGDSLGNQTTRPFASGCSGTLCGERIRMKVSTGQSIETVQNSGESQTGQRVTLVLCNDPGGGCDGAIEFAVRIFCAGTNCGTNANAKRDPEQAGRPFVGAPLKAYGQPTLFVVGSTTTTLWTSVGNPTASLPIGNKLFGLEMSWNNFVHTLRQVTRLDGKNGDDNAAVASIFGANWTNRANWQLHQVRFGQEVYNPAWQDGAKAYVGGKMNWVEVEAFTAPP